ncbi:ABC transporter substrate-binding protein [Mesorhizobium sp. VK25A]|uniref:ABC transporter substrate-binding protein n=1 Tax=Mesorhizobium vachelliae TaxID=3072309 RepID=A0ABU5AA55_9HYPH|nr:MULTISPECIES: ABC transporter substrate-binding protein [unclassified Mesorhizobium]MDX8533083.1 ABC transporter substrate-binding protein [Mesorhizobium sp. VK25D]MDX8545002.1 ABC transporter substrate-binding protein [Mesorhizobium sp. VK25A]
MKVKIVAAAMLLSAATPSLADETVSYASYGGAYQEGVRKAILDHLPADQGMKVTDYVLANGIQDIRTKVKANAVDIDVAELYGGLCDQAVKEDLIIPLDYSKIPNASGIPENLRKSHWIGFTAYSTVLAYNKETYGANPPKNWADFFDVQKFPGTRSMGGTYPSTNLEIALLADGVPKDKIYPVDIDRAIKKWVDFKPNISVRWGTGAQATQLATSQEADMMTIWAARIEAAIKDGAPYAYTLNDAVMDVECLVVPKNSPNPEGAMRLINNLLDPKYQANLPDYIPYGPMNQDAFKKGLISPEKAAKIVTSVDNIKKQLITNMSYWADHIIEAQTKWDAAMQ